MAQSATQPTGRTGSIQTQLDRLSKQLENLTDQELVAMSDQELVALRDRVKSLEDQIESVRKEQIDREAKDRIEPGDSLFGLSHIESHRKFVAEDEMSVVMRAVAKGIDYSQFIDVNASKLAEIAPEIAEIGRREYTYLR